MITFYGYAVKKDGKWLGYNPKETVTENCLKSSFTKARCSRL